MGAKKIEAELLKATEQDAQADGESRKKFVKRIAKGVSKLSDDQWAELSEPVQEWANAAIASLKKNEAPADFDPWQEEPEAEAEEPAKKTSKKSGKSGGKKSGGAKKAAKAPVDRSKTPIALIRKTVCQHIDWDREKVRASVEKTAGKMNDGTFNIAFYGVRNVITTLEELGKLKK